MLRRKRNRLTSDMWVWGFGFMYMLFDIMVALFWDVDENFPVYICL